MNKILIAFMITLSTCGSIKMKQIPDFYIITEAYLIIGDTTINLQDSFVNKRLGIMFSQIHDSILISVHFGNIDSVKYLGFAKKISNPGFHDSNNATYYLWRYKIHNVSKLEQAYVLLEPINVHDTTNDYYFFSIRNFDTSEFQFYAYKIDTKTETK